MATGAVQVHRRSRQALQSPPAWALAAAAAALAAVAMWVTARAGFLEHPGWLAVQKADIILGPVLVGLYWLRGRPESRFGPLLIATGFIAGAPYILQSSSDPVLFATGVLWEGPIYLSVLLLILTFPSGCLDGRAERAIFAAGAVAVALKSAIVLISPQLAGDGSISDCRLACPPNGLRLVSDPALAVELARAMRVTIVLVALATIVLIVWRLASGTPPRRRALALGAPIALAFLLSQAAYQSARLLELEAGDVYPVIQWTIVGTRASIWYGFLLALVAAELFAGRMLRRVVIEALRRPAPEELEAMLREPLGDPTIRLAFRERSTDRWVDARGAALASPDPASGRVLTEVQRDGRVAAAIVHDAQLAEEPELLRAGGAIVLLVQENAELDAGWKESLHELRGFAPPDRRGERGRATQARARPARRRSAAPGVAADQACARERAGGGRPGRPGTAR